MKIAYLVNQYPKVSHSFIRREILALEAQGVAISRFSVRSCWDELVDTEDIEEAHKTRYLLAGNHEGKLTPKPTPKLTPKMGERSPKTPLPKGFIQNLGEKLGVMVRLGGAVVQTALSCPQGLGRGLQWAISRGWKSDRGLILHVIYLAEACLLRRWLRADRISHIHAHFGTNSATVALLCQVLGGVSYSMTVHGPEEFDKPLGIHLGEKTARSRFTVAISSFGKSQLFRWCDRVHWDKVQVVHCGVDDRFLNSKIVPLPAEKRWVCVGRLGEQKGHLLLMEAVGQLAAEGYDFQLVLVGDGPLRPQIESLMAQWNLGDRVQITGWASAEQVQQHILQAQASILPSFAEGLPVVIMESLALARPVVSTYIAGMPELVQPGVCGWLVPAGSLMELKEALRVLAQTPRDRLESMGAAGVDLIAQNHNIHTEAAKLKALWQRYGV